MKRWGIALALVAVSLGSLAQEPCPAAGDASQASLLGLWRAEFEGVGHVGTLLLAKHPEFAETVRGMINRDGERRQVAGDLGDGEFTLEETADGVHIAATWLGEVVEGSCGREIRGTWKAEGAADGHAFVLRKD